MDHSTSISCSTQFGKLPWCPERDINCRAWFMCSLLGSERAVHLHPLPQTIPASSMSLYFKICLSHEERTQDYIAWLNWSHKEEPPEFQMCSQCISICLWHKDCNAPEITDLSVPYLKVFRTPVPCLTLFKPCKFLPHRALHEANRRDVEPVPELCCWECHSGFGKNVGESLPVLTKLKHNEKVNRRWKKGQIA